MHDTDAELMRRATADDQAAFAELVRRYEGALRRVAHSRLASVEAAEDVVQETFLAVYRSRHSYQDQFGFRTWLWTILLNQCRRYAGRQSRSPAVLPFPATEHAAAIVEVADDAALAGLLAHERRELLDNLLSRLSPVQGDALRLRFFGGLKFQEIADTMQCSLCTAKNRVRWGLLKLSQLIREEATPNRPTGERPSEAGSDAHTGDDCRPFTLGNQTDDM